MGSRDAILYLAWRTALGGIIAAALGVLLPYGIRTLFRRDLAPEYLKTPILLGGALAVYAAGEAIQPETGLVGATLFGVVLANIDVTGLQELKRFKESLTVFLVSGLFILLTANIDRQTVAMLSWPIVLTTLAILFIARPFAIGLATMGVRSAGSGRGVSSPRRSRAWLANAWRLPVIRVLPSFCPSCLRSLRRQYCFTGSRSRHLHVGSALRQAVVAACLSWVLPHGRLHSVKLSVAPACLSSW
jgi:NhaP-type Na+/H+ or K+/H+ antiporter